MIQIDWKSGVPAYDQIVSGIIKLKALGVLKPNDKLPSVRNFALKLGVNPNTVQRSYLILESKGIICSIAGKGSFISDNSVADNEIKKEALKSFKKAIENCKDFGLSEEELILAIAEVYKKED